jgi:hypothetical protein
MLPAERLERQLSRACSLTCTSSLRRYPRSDGGIGGVNPFTNLRARVSNSSERSIYLTHMSSIFRTPQNVPRPKLAFSLGSFSPERSAVSLFRTGSATASNPPLSAWRAQTRATSGRQGRSREAGARQRQPLRPDAGPVYCRQQQAITDLTGPHRTRISDAMRRGWQSSG